MFVELGRLVTSYLALPYCILSHIYIVCALSKGFFIIIDELGKF
jgi:hypothetical protein